MADSIQTMQSAIAVVLVVIYSWSRYNTPTTARSETTWGKFLLGRLAYVAIILGTFAVLVASPTVAEPLVEQFWEPSEGSLEDIHQELAFPLIVALILTVFLSEVPVLSRIDHALRGYFHRIAAIPREQRMLIAMLRRSSLQVPEDVRAEAVKRLKTQGLREEDLTLEGEESPERLWTRLTIHAVCLERLAENRKYAAHLLQSEQYNEFRRSYGHLAEKARHAFPLLRSGSREKAVGLLQQEFMEHARNLLTRLYDLMSRLILNCERTERQRRTCMASLGLDPQDNPAPPPVHEFVWLLLLLMAFLSLAIGGLGGDLQAIQLFSIALAQLAAVVIALVVHPAVPDTDELSVPPVGRYLLAGGLAFAAWMILRGGMEVLVNGEFFELLRENHSPALTILIQNEWPWSLMTVSVAVILCALTDDWIEERIHRVRDRFDLRGWANPFDGMITALGIAVTAAFLVHPLLSEPPVDKAWLLGLTASGLGFMLGLVVPSVYRKRRRQDAAGDGLSPA